MIVLAIDTSTTRTGLALVDGPRTLARRTWDAGRRQTVELAPAIEALMGTAGVSAPGVEAVSVARGPGGFTSLRVGIATAKGLALALGIPVVAIDTLALTAAPHLAETRPVRPLLDAGRGAVATALYRPRAEGGDAGSEPVAVEALGLVPLAQLAEVIEGPCIVCGEPPAGVVAALQARVRPAWLDMRWVERDPVLLAALGLARVERGELDDVAELEPLYVRGPSITQPRAR